MDKHFAIFILTHGRADKLYTLKALKKGGYTGKTYLLIDNEDSQADEYIHKYGRENVVIFDKAAVIKKTDTMDNFEKHNAIVYARNAVFDVAKTIGLDYFLMLDDDYTAFEYRYVEGNALRNRQLRGLDSVFEAVISFMEKNTNVLTVAFAQGGDFVGGLGGANFWKGFMRKAMNSFFCRTTSPIEFRGTMNEDVVTYTTLGSRGMLFLSYTGVHVNQLATQSLKGGMTEEYQKYGTYLKTFYAVMSMPSCVKIAQRFSYKRIHHSVLWDNCVPKILNERYQKMGGDEGGVHRTEQNSLSS